jgi:serine phosphatase RsbU (regulator of sigma subunit)
LEATIPPNRDVAKRKSRAISAPEAAGGMQLEALVRWLQAAMAVLQSAAGSTDFFDQAAGALVDMVGLESGQVLLLDKGNWKVQALHTAPRILMGADRQPSRQVLHRVLTEKRTFWQVPSTGPEGGSLMGVNALVAAPILDPKGEVIGALYGDRGQSSGFHTFRPITKLEAMLVELLAGGVAAGLARLEQEQAALENQKKFLKVERDLEIGRKIQIGFLPEELPQPPGWEIGAFFKPAREVSGDFYDVFPISDCHHIVLIADVCDKGVGAALFMALFRTLIRAFSQQTLLRGFLSLPAAKHSRTSNTEGRRLNNLLVDLNVLATVELTNHYVTSIHGKAFMFVTLFIGILDTTTGDLVYVNAGHDSPAVIGPKGVKKRLPPTGPVVGLMPDSAYDLDKLKFEPGDILFAYTDGVTDARDPAGQLFTEKRLLTVLEQPAPSATALLDRVVANLHTHIASADPFDDITMLAVRWTV